MYKNFYDDILEHVGNQLIQDCKLSKHKIHEQFLTTKYLIKYPCTMKASQTKEKGAKPHGQKTLSKSDRCNYMKYKIKGGLKRIPQRQIPSLKLSNETKDSMEM